MRGDLRKTAELGEVVAAAFDNAADYSTNLMLRNQRVRTTSSRWPLFVVGEQS